jgi:hypothetical protein
MPDLADAHNLGIEQLRVFQAVGKLAEAYDPSGKAHDFSRGMKARSLHHRAGPFPHHAGILS